VREGEVARRLQESRKGKPSAGQGRHQLKLKGNEGEGEHAKGISHACTRKHLNHIKYFDFKKRR
jgi:hypothetical protein